MLPIIVKDLYCNSKIWGLFVLVSIASAIVAVDGMLYGLTIAAGLIFAHSVVFAERKRRHLIFLKSLPITDSEIVGAKFIAALVLTLTLAGISGFVQSFTGGWGFLHSSLAGLSLLVFYTSLVVGLYIIFRNPALPFIPLYLAALLVIWGKASLKLPFLVGSMTAVSLSLIGSFIIYGVALFIFRRKEIDF